MTNQRLIGGLREVSALRVARLVREHRPIARALWHLRDSDALALYRCQRSGSEARASPIRCRSTASSKLSRSQSRTVPSSESWTDWILVSWRIWSSLFVSTWMTERADL